MQLPIDPNYEVLKQLPFTILPYNNDMRKVIKCWLADLKINKASLFWVAQEMLVYWSTQ